MAETSRHDAWQAGDRYEAYMGRWSRLIAPLFLDWLCVGDRLDWLDIGCGTGALSAAILAKCNPKSLISTDSSEEFVLTARSSMQDRGAEFQVGDAQALSLETASRDVVVSALMLNFVPDKLKALREMKRVARTGGRGVIAGLDPAIYLSEITRLFNMDARVKPAHDESMIARTSIMPLSVFPDTPANVGS